MAISEPRTVYILGAGVNQIWRNRRGDAPPLEGTVFKVGLSIRHLAELFDSAQFEHLRKFLAWDLPPDLRRTREELCHSNLSIEGCFDRAEELRQIAAIQGESSREMEFSLVKSLLTQFMARTLHELSTFNPLHEIEAVGRILLAEDADVLTFNYDTLVENSLEQASPTLPIDRAEERLWESYDGRGGTPPPMNLSYHEHEWEPLQHYHVRFDRFRIRQPSGHHLPGFKEYFDGRATSFRSPKFLKLHGSLDWAWVTNRPILRNLPPNWSSLDSGKQVGKLVRFDHLWSLDKVAPNYNYLELDPLIATGPDKARMIEEPPLRDLWNLAAEALERCDRLVVIGFSFSGRDERARDLVRLHVPRGIPVKWVSPNEGQARETAVELGLTVEEPIVRGIAEYIGTHPATRLNQGRRHS